MGVRIEFRNVSAGYEDVPVLRNFSFEAEPGQLTVLSGPSGCGKSTVLRLIAGLMRPEAGDILFDGSSVKNVPAEKRGVSMAFQELSLFPSLTVRQNLEICMPKGKRTEKTQSSCGEDGTAQYLRLVRLEEFADRDPKELSGGQQRRVSLARALAAERQILLLDEPFNGIEEELREELCAAVKKIVNESDKTAILVTHDKEDADRFADKIVRMRMEEIGAKRRFVL